MKNKMNKHLGMDIDELEVSFDLKVKSKNKVGIVKSAKKAKFAKVKKVKILDEDDELRLTDSQVADWNKKLSLKNLL